MSLLYFALELLDVHCDFLFRNELVEHLWALVRFNQVAVVLYVGKRWVENPQDLIAKPGQDGDGTNAEHYKNKRIIKSPLDVVDLRVRFLLFIERQAFILLLKVQEFRRRRNAVGHANKQHLAVKHMRAIQNHCEQVVAVVRSDNQIDFAIATTRLDHQAEMLYLD